MKFTYTPPGKPIEPGLHTGVVVDAEETISSGGHDQIILEIRLEGGFKIKDRLTASPKAFWRLTQAFVAFGYSGSEGKDVELTPEKLVGNSVTVRIDKGKPRDDGKVFLEIVEYVPPPTVPI